MYAFSLLVPLRSTVDFPGLSPSRMGIEIASYIYSVTPACLTSLGPRLVPCIRHLKYVGQLHIARTVDRP